MEAKKFNKYMSNMMRKTFWVSAMLLVFLPHKAKAQSCSVQVLVSDVTCFGGNDGSVVTLPSGTSPYTYSWSNGKNSQFNSNLIAGSYTVTVTDALGCVATQTVTVGSPTASGISGALTQVTCPGGMDGSIDITVNGGTSPYTYLW
ncbi:MAG TPA: hypothetical protein DCL07_05245, partial [Cryomorphaceae bacterium]|nr:hypothetical protein [Cryomorphaceae bacterium]